MRKAIGKRDLKIVSKLKEESRLSTSSSWLLVNPEAIPIPADQIY